MMKALRQSRRYPSGERLHPDYHSQLHPVKKYFLVGAGVLTIITVAALVLALKILFVVAATVLAAVAGAYLFIHKKLSR
jgi:hypothetical protein